MILEILSWIFTGVSLIGGFLVTGLKPKTRLIAFILWIISNIFWVIFNIYNKHYSPAFLFFVYTIQSTIGIISNARIIKNKVV